MSVLCCSAVLLHSMCVDAVFEVNNIFGIPVAVIIWATRACQYGECTQKSYQWVIEK